MGKTSLLQHYAAEVAERGVHAVWGTCWEGDQAPALWPWTQVVRTLLDQDRDEEAVTAELVVVLPERAHIAGGVGRSRPPQQVASKTRQVPQLSPATRRAGCGCSTQSGGSSDASH